VTQSQPKDEDLVDELDETKKKVYRVDEELTVG
jgi:hypothetical protein